MEQVVINKALAVALGLRLNEDGTLPASMQAILKDDAERQAARAKEDSKREFEVFPAKDDSWHWHAKAGNGKVTFQGQGHPSSWNAVRAIRQELKALGSTIEPSITILDKSGKEDLHAGHVVPGTEGRTSVEIKEANPLAKVMKEVAPRRGRSLAQKIAAKVKS